MDEFNNRMETQRSILNVVNRLDWREELFGLSSSGLSRWASANNIAHDSELLELLHAAGGKLFFLANKSQEQITDEYKSASREVADLIRRIENAVSIY